MIVVDANVIAYLWIPGEHSPLAEKILKKDSRWVVPVLWRSEFQSVLAGCLRQKKIDFPSAQKIMAAAEGFFKNREYQPSSLKVLDFIAQSSCSAYDCTYVALADEFKLKLVTMDKAVLKEFPKITVAAEDFASD